MAERDAEHREPPAEGLAGGPGPTPPGFDDGTPKPLDEPAGGPPAGADGGRERRAPRGDPEEPDPS